MIFVFLSTLFFFKKKCLFLSLSLYEYISIFLLLHKRGSHRVGVVV